jgi:membrane protease YdiL (CAAX protease family)
MSDFVPHPDNTFEFPEVAIDAIILGDDDLIGSDVRVYGFWATSGLTISMLVLLMALQMLPVAFCAVTATPTSVLAPLQFNGLLLSLGMIVSMPWVMAAIVLLASSRPGLSAREYLGFKRFDLLSLAGWFFAAVCVVLGMEVVGRMLGASPLTEFSKQIFLTAGWLPLLWFAIVLLPPIFEEVLFRGFMFRGISESPIGNWGAVLITTILWTLLHVGQYGPVPLLQLFMLGIVLGLSRARTGSVIPAIIIHFANNLAAMIQTTIYMEP